MAGRKAKPIRVVEGPVCVKIYSARWKKYRAWAVTYHIEGRRVRRKFASVAMARAEARRVAISLAKGQQAVASMTPADRASWARATALLAPTGKALEIAAAEYAEASAVLKSLEPMPTLGAVAMDYARRHRASAPTIMIDQAIAEMIEAKKQDGIGHRHLEDLTQGLARFARDFNRPLASISAREVDHWLRAMTTRSGRRVSGRTRNNARARIANLFNWARRRAYLPADHSGLFGVDRAKLKSQDIEIFSPAEFRLILVSAKSNLLPYLLFGGFAGLRTSETERLDWRQIDFSRGWLTVPAASKTGRRIVPVCQALTAWITPCRRQSGHVHSLLRISSAIRNLVSCVRKTDPDFKWKRNGLRHSWISYRLAETQDLAQVALEAGNTPAIILRHYRELVTPEEARKWFAIRPTPSRIVKVRFK